MEGEDNGEGGGSRPASHFGFEFKFNPKVFWNCSSITAYSRILTPLKLISDKNLLLPPLHHHHHH